MHPAAVLPPTEPEAAAGARHESVLRSAHRWHDRLPWLVWLGGALTFFATLWLASPLDLGRSIAPLDLSPAVTVLWLAGYLTRPDGWRRPQALAAMVTIVAGGEFVARMAQDPWGLGLWQGASLLIQGVVTLLVWSHALRPTRASHATLGVWRHFVTCVLGAGAGLITSPALPHLWGDVSLLGAWLLHASAPVFVVTLLLWFFATGRHDGLPAPQPAVVAALVLVTALVLRAEVAEPQLYLLVPVVVWAASVLDTRWTMVFTVAVIGAPACVLVVQDLETTTALSQGALFTANVFPVIVAALGVCVVRARVEALRLQQQVEARRWQAADAAETFGTILAATQDAVLTVDADRRVLLANQAAHSLAARFGIAAADLLDALQAEAAAKGELDPVARVLSGEDFGTGDATVPTAEGEQRVLCVRAFPMRRRSEPEVVLFVSDCTEERRQAEGLRQFARTVAHDLRNPLAGIQLSTEMAAAALDEGDTAEAAAMVAAITASGDRAAQLLADLSDYSLAGSGQLAEEDVRLDEFVQAIADQRAADTGAAPLRVEIDAPVTVHVDRRLLARVLDNLLGNAAKYRHPDRPASVTVMAYDDAHGRAEVLVMDRGIGIPAGREKQIFEPFHRVPEHVAAFPGSGLGLAIVREVVERHGGTITASPREDGGTVFRFSLPLAGPAAAARRASARAAAAAAQAAAAHAASVDTATAHGNTATRAAAKVLTIASTPSPLAVARSLRSGRPGAARPESTKAESAKSATVALAGARRGD